jgi:ABC-type uncharacterized transport system permease subunit
VEANATFATVREALHIFHLYLQSPVAVNASIYPCYMMMAKERRSSQAAA